MYISADLGMCGMRELYSGLRRLGMSGLERMEKTNSKWEYMSYGNMNQLWWVCFIQYVVFMLCRGQRSASIGLNSGYSIYVCSLYPGIYFSRFVWNELTVVAYTHRMAR